MKNLICQQCFMHHKSSLVWLWLVGMLLLLSQLVLGQSRTFYEHGHKIEHFQIEDGLPDDHVGGIHQASNGYMWLSCPSGFLKYDGLEFERYNIPDEYRTYDDGDHLNDIIEVPNGDIFISTFGGGIYQFDSAKKTFKKHLTNNRKTNIVLRLESDSLGKVWFGSLNGFHILSENDSIQSFTLKTIEKALNPVLDSLNKEVLLDASFQDIALNKTMRFPLIIKEKSSLTLVGIGKNWKREEWNDDGWIENEIGDTIWRPDLSKNIFAGGSFNYNRAFIDTISLNSGEYNLVLRKSKYKKPNLYNQFFRDVDVKLPKWDGIKILRTNQYIQTTFEKIIDNYQDESGLMDGFMTSIYKDTKGDFWWFTLDEVGRIKRVEDSITFEPICNGFNQPKCPCKVTAVLEFDKDNLWVCGKRYIGLNKEVPYLGIYNDITKEFKEIKTGLPVHRWMDTRELFMDNQSNIWLGTQFKGVYKMSPPFVAEGEEGTPNIVHFNFGFKEENRGAIKSPDVVFNFHQDKNNHLWVGTQWGGLYKIDLKKPNFQVVDLSKIVEESNVWNFVEDINRQVWIGTSAKGLIQYNRISDDLTVHTKEFKGIAIEQPMSPVLKLPNENILFRTPSKHILYNPKTDKIEKVMANMYKSQTDMYFTSFIINDSIAFMPNGNLLNFNSWTNVPIAPYHIVQGTADKTSNIFWLDFRTDVIKFRLNEDNTLDTIETKRVQTFISDMMADKNGDCWAMTIVGFINVSKENPFTDVISEVEGKPINYYGSTILDKKGHIWFFSASGSYRYDDEKSILLKVPQLDKIKSHAYVRMNEDGEIILIGNENLSFFHPDSLTIDTIPPQISIESLTYKGKEETKTIPNSLSLKHLELRHFQNNLSLEYLGINFNNPENITYVYQLENHQKDWQNVGTERIARFSNLSPGNYIFKVKAANADGIWSEPKELKITIHPPWWKTWWAYFLYVLAIIGTIFWYIRSLNQKLQKEQSHNKELTDLNTANQRFVPNDFLQILGKKSIKDLHLGDQTHTQMTILFSDIRSYTTLSEKMTPQENFNFINAYLGRVGPIIKAHGGFISQYMGDGFMALFVEDSSNAAQAAIAIQKELEVYNQERISFNKVPLKTGIGLNTGDLMLGVIGDEYRYESTVISDAVNTASRMEGLTKTFGAAIILSEKTLAGLLDNFPLSSKLKERDNLLDNGNLSSKTPFAYRSLGKVKVKGKDKALKIYDLYEGESVAIRELKARTKPVFEQGITHYFNRQFGKAAECFKQVLEVHEADLAAQYYMDKSVGYIVDGVKEDWSGVEEMVMK